MNAKEKDIEIMKEYLLLKFREGDWHGVSDAANDIRVIEARSYSDSNPEFTWTCPLCKTHGGCTCP